MPSIPPSYTTDRIRNVALTGHPGAGKTTLFEALLHAGGAIATAGTVERGNTVSDFDPQEKARGHSLDAAIASVDHAPAGQPPIHVNLVDTPGDAPCEQQQQPRRQHPRPSPAALRAVHMRAPLRRVCRYVAPAGWPCACPSIPALSPRRAVA